MFLEKAICLALNSSSFIILKWFSVSNAECIDNQIFRINKLQAPLGNISLVGWVLTRRNRGKKSKKTPNTERFFSSYILLKTIPRTASIMNCWKAKELAWAPVLKACGRLELCKALWLTAGRLCSCVQCSSFSSASHSRSFLSLFAFYCGLDFQNQRW